MESRNEIGKAGNVGPGFRLFLLCFSYFISMSEKPRFPTFSLFFVLFWAMCDLTRVSSRVGHKSIKHMTVIAFRHFFSKPAPEGAN